MTVDEVVALLERHGCTPRRAGAGWVALCPAHDDRRPSLSVSEGRDGQILLHCFSGCTLESILAALGLRWSDLFPDDPLRRRDYRPKRTWTFTLRSSEPKTDLVQYVESCRLPSDHPRLEAIARGLGVSPESLVRLRTGWDHERQAVVVPMCDALGRVVGIRFRRADGSKLSLRGGSEGLFLPIDLQP
ncbi:MAG: CHC2 zinc finger domain-containing protein, partial [Thermogutta sp.]